MTARATAERKPVPEIMIADLLASTREVFDTMVFIDAVAGEPHEGVEGEPEADVVATVALTGPSNAVVTIYATVPLAKTIAASMLGMTAGEITGEFADALGELANMIAGTFRNRLTEHGGTWALSVPTVTIGSHVFTHYPEDAARVACPHDVGGHVCTVELVLRS